MWPGRAHSANKVLNPVNIPKKHILKLTTFGLDMKCIPFGASSWLLRVSVLCASCRRLVVSNCLSLYLLVVGPLSPVVSLRCLYVCLRSALLLIVGLCSCVFAASTLISYCTSSWTLMSLSTKIEDQCRRLQTSSRQRRYITYYAILESVEFGDITFI